MKTFTKRTLAVTLSALLAPMGAQATNGMFMIGYGPKMVSMGGTAIANPQDSLAGAVNPATITEFNIRADAGAELFLPSAKATLGRETANEITHASSADTFVIPNMAMAMKFNRKISFGFSAVGVGGGGSRYNKNLYNIQNNVSPDETLGVNLMIMQMNPTAAYRINKDHSVGASLIISAQTFRAFGLGEFSTFTVSQSTNPGNHGNDWSYGAGVRVGWLGKFMNDRLMLGASGSPRVYMSKFRKYDELFAEQGDIDTPPVFGVGLSYKLTDNLTVAMDVSRTLYSEIASISNVGPNSPDKCTWVPGYDCNSATVPQSEFALGADKGLGFGWKDQTVYKLGIAYKYDPNWTFRAGWNYGKSPIDETDGSILFNIVAPATTQHHLTLGASYQLSDMLEVSMSYMRAFRHKQYGPTYIGSSGEIGMAQNALGVGIGLSF